MMNMDEMKGKAKQKMGDMTDNEREQAEGMEMEARGKAKSKLQDAKDKLDEERREYDS